MAPHLTSDVENSIKPLLFNKASFSAIQKLYLTILLSALTRYRKQYLGDVKILKGGRPNKTSKSTKSYITRQLRTGRLDGSKGVQEHLRMEDWRQWVFSDETRANMWGTDGNILSFCRMPHVQEYGEGVMFWSCITAKGPVYGTLQLLMA
ncbi:hypothetical protein INT46_010408 [Mucor plumbeus]|uniref:Uncharacterized protein n=1 Tax=Mucor plumbeus TaxID=97098 RepID=A0A8H7UXF8_9FUNG|nr:hypothetical protein INT46_010408 [Mucor plumbeus]